MSPSEIKNVTLSSKGDRVKKDKKKHKKDEVKLELVCEQQPEDEKEEEEQELESETESESGSETETETVSDPETEEETESEDDKVSFSTTDILQNDPLYFVLSKIFISDDNINIANILQDINKKLDVIMRRSK